jgi:arginyl-tRNA--protein-N-Asp/Glu arginylyltransferase
MFAQVHNPLSLAPETLDEYLSKGWFRMGQTIFTTNFLSFKGEFYSAIWLKIDLKNKSVDKLQQKLAKQNTPFRIEIKKATITDEKEKLFELYKSGINFEASSSLQYLLFSKEEYNIYNTQEVVIYDQEKMIAVGYFDLGKNSAAGITCFYDPSYKKYSLGKYLIYLKINYCRDLGMEYFYPGYFVPGYSFFDYKLEIEKSSISFYQLSSQQWLPIKEFTEDSNPLFIMRKKLEELEVMIREKDTEVLLLQYEFYNANMVPEFNGLELFDYPLFLYCYQIDYEIINPIIVFDVLDMKYHLLQCGSIYQNDSLIMEGENYSAHLLKTGNDIFSAGTAGEMFTLLQMASERREQEQ